MPQENTNARQAVRAAQKQFERESDAAHKARRKAFAQAQKEGLSLRASARRSACTTRASARSFNRNGRLDRDFGEAGVSTSGWDSTARSSPPCSSWTDGIVIGGYVLTGAGSIVEVPSAFENMQMLWMRFGWRLGTSSYMYCA